MCGSRMVLESISFFAGAGTQTQGESSTISSIRMENRKKQGNLANPLILQSEELYEYILATSVYPREPEPLKELRKAIATQPLAYFGTSPDAGQLIAMFLKIVNAKKTIEIGVFTGYSLLLTALTIPDDGKITAIDVDRTKYEIGLPIIQKAGLSTKLTLSSHELYQFLMNCYKIQRMKGVLTLLLLMLTKLIIGITMRG